MRQAGIDMEQIRKDFFASGDDCVQSIKTSRAYIIVCCTKQKKTIWDFVRDQMYSINADTGLSGYQKSMSMASLLPAWEDIEKNDEQIALELHRNARENPLN